MQKTVVCQMGFFRKQRHWHKEINGDYVTVAHIGPDRVVTFYDKDLPANIKAMIEGVALTSDAKVSTSQPEKRVFHTPPQAHSNTAAFSQHGKSPTSKPTLSQRLESGRQRAAQSSTDAPMPKDITV